MILQKQNIMQVLDTQLKNISKTVAKVEICNVDNAILEEENSSSFIANISGDYILTIIFQAGSLFMRTITENMKHKSSIDDTDIKEYSGEYFNIFCGHVVSNLNNANNAKARFGIPILVSGSYMTDQTKPLSQVWKQCYQSNYGQVIIQTIYQS